MAVVAEFSADKELGQSPLMVQFTDLSTGSPDTWLWDFGVDFIIAYLDTTDVIFLDTADVVWASHTYDVASNDQHPQYTYRAVGFYTVTLTATLAGDSDTEIKTSFIVIVENFRDRPSMLYSGVKEAYCEDGWENFKHFFIVQDQPFPCVVQYIDLYVNTTNE